MAEPRVGEIPVRGRPCQSEQSGRLALRQRGQRVCDPRAQIGDPTELGRVEILRLILAGVDGDIGPVVEVEHRHAPARGLEDLMIAAHLDGADIAEKDIARGAGSHEAPVSIASALRVLRGGRDDFIEEGLANIVEDVGQRGRGPRQVECGVGDGEQGADHVHMNAAHDPRGEVRMAREPGLRARDLRRPQEANGEARLRDRAARDRAAQGASDFEDGGAA